MTSLTPTDFSRKFIEIAGDPLPFQPHAYHDKDGDCVEFLSKPDAFYGERIDSLVTVYRSQETDEVIGALIKGVKSFCAKILAKYPGFDIEVVDGKVKLACLFRAQAWSTSGEGSAVRYKITYRKLIEAAEESGTEMELCENGA